MKLGVTADGTEFHHDVRESFGELLRSALRGERVLVGHGPIYADDPAAEVMAPFRRSADESGWSFNELILPEWVIHRARELRAAQITREMQDLSIDNERLKELDRWTRAGLVLEIASRWGIPRIAGYRIHPKWKLRGTVTGRFGIEEGSKFNPMTIAERDRHTVVTELGFGMATMDFNAMDLRSMISLIPDMREWYDGANDLHQRTADIMDIDRDEAKQEIFVHAYGGYSKHRQRFLARMPYLSQLHEGDHGDGARRVQTQSARAFRGALSEALPLLVGENLRPLFTVHDELTVEYREGTEAEVYLVMCALERGASQTIGVDYRVKGKVGRNYRETKDG